MQALENAKANDLLFWASRYNLFVLWSADRTHPWDSLPGAASYVTLEIGKQRGSDSEVCPMHQLSAAASAALLHIGISPPSCFSSRILIQKLLKALAGNTI
jgi:hypothetical protein